MNDNIKEKLNESVKKYNKIKEEVEKLIKTESENITNIILDIPKVKCIVFFGYTPSFNDGDPCYHYSDYDINTDPNGSTSNEEIAEIINCNSDELIDFEFNVGFKFNVGIKNALKIIDDYCQSLYETNYRVIIYRDQHGNIVWDHKEVDCGY